MGIYIIMLLERIQFDLKNAVKEKNEKETAALRMLIAAIKNEEIAKRPAVLGEVDILAVAGREIKKLNDAVNDFLTGGRTDLAEKYREEIKILSRYVPERLSEEDTRRIVKDIVAKAAEKNFANVMKAAMAELKGRSDGALVSKIVKEEIG